VRRDGVGRPGSEKNRGKNATTSTLLRDNSRLYHSFYHEQVWITADRRRQSTVDARWTWMPSRDHQIRLSVVPKVEVAGSSPVPAPQKLNSIYAHLFGYQGCDGNGRGQFRLEFTRVGVEEILRLSRARQPRRPPRRACARRLSGLDR